METEKKLLSAGLIAMVAGALLGLAVIIITNRGVYNEKFVRTLEWSAGLSIAAGIVVFICWVWLDVTKPKSKGP